MPRLREFFGLLQVCLLCKAPDESADFGKMDRSCLADRATWFCFQQHIDERTALKGLFSKPAVEHVENCQQPSVGTSRAPPNLRFQPIACPYRLPSIQKRNRKLNFVVEIAVKTGLCAT